MRGHEHKHSVSRKVLQWIAGLMLLVVFSATLLVFGFYRITAPGPSKEMLGRVIATAAMPAGASVSTIVERMKLMARSEGPVTVEFTRKIKITAASHDIRHLSDGETERLLYRELGGKLYEKGPDIFLAAVDDPGVKRKLGDLRDTVYFFVSDFHRTVKTVLAIFAVLSGVFFLIMFLMGHRFGRLAVPGVIMVAATLPALVILFSFGDFFAELLTVIPGGVQSGAGRFFSGDRASLLEPMVAMVRSVYLFVCIAGTLMIMAAGAGKLYADRTAPDTEKTGE
ncbi:MAG TPA: hypothetical protein PK544_18680 [Spirochaetota bacterium]|nr:hypothetical protein [Spirochaetota bacterium]HPQ53500.1 hypothetical protein [Spirochaetota bacterium]